jgi:Glucose-regulated metallo-peptidase M90
MRQSFAHIVAAPFMFAALVILFISWTRDSDYAIWLVPPVLCLALVYIFAPQLNWWWYRRRPPVLPDKLVKMMEAGSVFYRNLPADGQQRFRERTALFCMGTDWQPMGMDDEHIPLDIQVAAATQAITLTFHKPQFLFPQFEKAIIAPQQFFSPAYPFLHASEMYEPDGCVILSAEHLMHAFAQPDAYFNVALFEYAKVFIRTYPDAPYPALADAGWAALENISGYTRAAIETAIGLAGIDILPAAIHHFFQYPDRFRAILPEAAQTLDEVFLGEVKGFLRVEG